MNTTGLGKAGEKAACDYLKHNRYEILCTNFAAAGGEIDIIARRGTHISFVEVKTRRNDKFGSGAESVNFRKQQKIIRAARAFLLKCKNYEDVSFDVCEVYTLKRVINYIENAFDA